MTGITGLTEMTGRKAPIGFAAPPPEPPEPSRDPAPTGQPKAPRVELMPQLLRFAGAALLVLAASSFLFREWGQESDATRYLMLLGQLGLLTFAGFFCGLKLDEKRGARTFLGLVVAVVPVHFAVLGGILYSQWALDTPVNHLTAHVTWQAGDVGTAVGLILGAQLLILPATFVAMMTLARQHALKLTASFVGVSALLLLPFREPDTIGLILALAVPAVLALQLRVFSGTAAASTPQGRFARFMIAVPLLLLAGRTLLYYEPTPIFTAVCIFSLGLVSFAYDVRADGERAEPSSSYGFSLAVPQFFAIVAMCLGWAVFSGEVVRGHLMDGGLHAFDVPLTLLPWAAIVLTASSQMAHGGPFLRRLVALGLMLGLCANLVPFNQVATGLFTLAVGLAVAFYGARVTQKAVSGLGVITAFVGLGAIGLLTIRLETLTHWGTLTAAGVALIFGAAFLDRNRQRLLAHVADAWGRVQQWKY